MRRVGRRPTLGLLAAATVVGVWAGAGLAHNNPDFKEVLLTTVEVAATPDAEGAHSAPFAIAEWPPKTIEFVWRVQGAEAADVTFAVARAGEVVAEGLTDEARSNRFDGEEMTIVDVAGASAPFTLEVYANVIDRSSSESG